MKKFIFVAFLLFALIAHSDEIRVAYICTTEESTGFLHSQGNWKISQFTERDFMIRKLRDDDRGANNKNITPYGVFELDEKGADMFCSVHDSSLTCSGLGELAFSSTTGRFIRTYTLAYISGEEDAKAKPRIMRGVCKPLPPGYKELPKKVHPPEH